jgi:hypothetical protein
MRASLPSQVVDLRSLCLNRFAKGFSDSFDFSRDKQYFQLLVECANKRLSLEAVCNLYDLSPDRLFFYLNRIDVDEMLEYTNQALHSCLSLLRKNGKKPPRQGFVVAVDTTDVEYYGERDMYVHNYVKRMGKVYKHILVRRYATLSIVAPGFKLCLAILPVRKEDKLEALVDRLLASVEGVRIRCVVLDKGFYNVGVLNRIEEHGLHYLLPVVKRDDLDRLYWLCHTTDKWKWGYTMAADRPWRKPVTVYFQERELGDYVGFATNLDIDKDSIKRLLALYDQRWNIENGYKEAEHFLIKTSSKNHAYRLLLYTISHLLVNIQNIVRETRYRVRYYEMTLIIQLLLDPTTKKGIHHITKRIDIQL